MTDIQPENNSDAIKIEGKDEVSTEELNQLLVTGMNFMHTPLLANMTTLLVFYSITQK